MDPSYPPDLPGSERSALPKAVDKSEAMFTMYLERSDEDDRKTTERWKRESDAILIFTGLFSIALASLIGISIQGLRPNSQDISAFYLKNIYYLFANTTSPGSVIITIPTDPPKFSPPRYAILVNSLWFLSLAMSLTGALLAVFIQQWAHSYLQATQGRHTPHDRARIRAFYAEGIDKLHLPRITGAMPVLIHVALFLFFSGLPIFLFSVDRTVFNVVITWMGLCGAGYACVTLMPIFRRDSPYYSPLSSSSWWCVTTALFVINRLLTTITSPSPDSKISRGYNARHSASHHHWPSLRSMRKVAETFALKLSSDIDYRGISWMFGTLNEDDEFEQFFDALPGLCDSEALEDPLEHFVKPNEKILSHALIGMMDRTLLSDVIPEPVKLRRIAVCAKAINATSLLEPWWILRRVLLGDWDGFSRSVQFGLFVQDWKSIPHDVTAFYAQYIVSVAISSAQERDDRWLQLTSGQLNVPKSLVQTYLAYGDSVLLTNVMFIMRQTISTYSRSADLHRSDILEALSRTLGSLCKLDILNTLPEQQHEFCCLWNQLVEAARNDSHPHMNQLFMMVLKIIRRLCITLHEGTGSFPKEFSITTDDEDPVLNEATWYPISHLAGNRPYVPPLLLQSDESSPDSAGNAGHATDRSYATTPALSPEVLLVLRSSPYTPYQPSLTGGYSTPPYFTKSHSPSALPPRILQTHTQPISQMHLPAAHSSTSAISPEPAILRPPMAAPTMAMPESHAVQQPPPSSAPTTAAHVPPIIPQMISPQPPSATIPMPIPSPKPARSIPFVGPIGTGGLSMPRSVVVPPSGRTMPVLHRPSSGYVPMPMPSPTVVPSGLAQPTTPMVAAEALPPDSLLLRSAMTMPAPAVVPSRLAQPTTPMPAAAPPPDSLLLRSTMDMPSQILKFNGYGEYAGLLYHSPDNVLYQDELYPTALHLFEARKFLDHRPDLAERIRQCERVEEVTAISAELAEFTRRDWGTIALTIMDEVLYLKFRQHGDLRALLLNTYPSRLLYVESGDPFWGDGAGSGLNELGKSLMRVREQLRQEMGLN